MLKTGIVGLPNVGKSSLFNALTKANALAANYPFATIEPNKGVVEVQDERLDYLVKMYQPKSVVASAFEFIDIAGLVKGASKGEGLGNQFLAQIREVDAICQVVRLFKDDNITHLSGKLDPLSDLETINIELSLSDLEVIEKRLPKLIKQSKAGDKVSKKELDLLKQIKEKIENNQRVKLSDFAKEDQKLLKGYNFLSLKPIIYLLNISEDQVGNIDEDPDFLKIKKRILSEGNDYVKVCVKLELELSQLSENEKKEYLEAYNLKQSALDELIKKSYSLLGLKTFFTAGKDECRAWNFKVDQTAPECAGIIHTDFERGFIAAEVISIEDLVEYKTIEAAKKKGKVRIEGKNYKVLDGDIIVFRFNV